MPGKSLLIMITMLVLPGLAACRQTVRRDNSSTLIPSSSSPTSIQVAEALPALTAAPTARPTETPVQIDLERRMIDQVDRDRALGDLRKLTGEEPVCINAACYTIANRKTGSEGLQWAKQYVNAELVGLGYSVEFNDWSSSDYTDQNLIVRQTGASMPDEEVYFVAHLDGVKLESAERFPAADDDASGAVDLLELARILSTHSLSRTVVLFFSTGEEQGTLGVTSYLERVSRGELRTIQAVVDVDMIGYDANYDTAMQIWHGDHPPSRLLAESISATIEAFQFNLEPALLAGCG